MATPYATATKLTNEMVEKAFDAWWKANDTPRANIRAALTAALAELDELRISRDLNGLMCDLSQANSAGWKEKAESAEREIAALRAERDLANAQRDQWRATCLRERRENERAVSGNCTYCDTYLG